MVQELPILALKALVEPKQLRALVLGCLGCAKARLEHK